VPGHEFAGVVAQGPQELVGQRVVGEISAVCGACAACRSGRRAHCADRTVLGIAGRNGAFAEFLALPAENLHPVPSRVSTDAATFVEPLAAALEIQQQVRVGPGDQVLVVGDGKLGQLIGQALALTGCDLLVAGRNADKLAHLSRRGVRVGRQEDVAPGMFDLAVECTGNDEGFALAHRGLRPRGVLVMKSTYAGQLSVDASALVVDEITLVGSRCGPFPPALRLLAAGLVQVEPLVTARYPLAEGLAAFARAGEKGVLKVLLEVGEA
jgi:threonine dehydrogenase-like Zn-dependent dehydrogenase